MAVMRFVGTLSCRANALVEEVSSQTEGFIFVLSKADRLSDGERKEAVRFAERVIGKRLSRQIGSILEVSATERLNHAGSLRDWTALVGKLQSLARNSGTDLVRSL
jgi:hypothetical protein